jgi:ABC-2 type transport system permease protein
VTDARIHDQGYRAYDGPRLGVSGAVRSVALHSVGRVLGYRRSAWNKVLPIISIAMAYVPAAVFVGVASFVPEHFRERADLLPKYSDYYGFITSAILLFIALVGPEVLCSDRRTGMLGLYLASPLDRNSYLFAKALAVLPVLTLVTVGPPLLLLVGLTFANAGPDGLGDIAVLVLRIVASGIAISAAYTALSLAAASLTDRRAIASAGLILFLTATAVATGILVDEAGADSRLLLLNLMFVPFELVQRIYGVTGDNPELGAVSLAAAELAWTFACAALVWWRYDRMTVNR